LLHQGEYPEGWQEYEWRLNPPQVIPFNCPHPRWDGTPQPKSGILIHTEQGSGDAIQFARYLPLVKQKFQRLLLVCIPELADLLGTVPGVDQVMLPGDIPLSAFQTYTSMMSLPLLFGTDADTIPQTVPYLRVPESSAQWKLPPASVATPRLKVGIVWAGSPTHKDDRRRSCRLTELLPFLKQPEVAFYSLQKRVTPLEQSQLREFGVIDLSEQLQTFSDTAAAMTQLDLVISVDTSVVHLAGALGRPAWTLLCYCPDWRWGLQGEQSPWYPTMRLFRQPQPGDWPTVMNQVQQVLSNWQP
jgi:hypothetical protein